MMVGNCIFPTALSTSSEVGESIMFGFPIEFECRDGELGRCDVEAGGGTALPHKYENPMSYNAPGLS